MKKTVLVVDDDRDLLEELEMTLSDCDYKVVTADDSVSARDVAQKIKPDVILMDFKMPVKSGPQLIREIKSFSEMNRVPVIAMSGYFEEDDLRLLNIYGIEGLKKPFNPLDMINRIETALLGEK